MEIIDFHHHTKVGVPLSNYDKENIIREHIDVMDKAGIDKAILTPMVDLRRFNSDDRYAMANDIVKNVCKKYSDRFSGFASIPIFDGKIAVSELERVSSSLELPGVMIKPLRSRIDYDYLKPFYAKAQDSGMTIFVHPAFVDAPYLFDGCHLFTSIGFMVDTTVAVTRLIFSGILDEFKKLHFVFGHLGGALPFLIGRIDASYECAKEDSKYSAKNVKRPLEYFRNFCFDTVCYHPAALKCTYEMVGSDNLLFGTDFGCPTKAFVDPKRQLENVDSMQMPENEKAKILSINAQKMLRRAKVAVT